MSVTEAKAIRFSDQRLRAGADMMAWAYYRCQAASDRWTGLGGGQPAIDVMEADIRLASDAVYDAYLFVYETEQLWFLLGGTGMIPNDAGESIVDGSPADGRPAVNGQQASQLMDRCIQFQNWLLSSTGSFTDPDRDTLSYINTILAVTSEADPVMSVANAGNFINRCDNLTADYDASSEQNLGYILAYAVNPQVN